MKKFLVRILALALAVLLLVSSAALADASVFTDEMVERSLFSVGNTQRLHKAIDKARNGEAVSMVYLGGSITEGASAQPQKTHCYAALSARLFAEKYMPDLKEGRLQEIEKEFSRLCMVELTIDSMTGKEAIELVRARQ